MPALAQLESQLWKAAWLLKGPVDAADFKISISWLLGFKRPSDVNAKAHAVALADFESAEEASLLPKNCRVQLLKDCHRQEVRKLGVKVGQLLQTALRGRQMLRSHEFKGPCLPNHRSRIS